MKKARPSTRDPRRKKATAARGELDDLDELEVAVEEPLDVAGASPQEASPSSPDEPAKDPLDDFFVGEEERQRALGFSGDFEASRVGRNIVELLAFWVADEEYAVEITEIQEIIKLPIITDVPRAHPSVMGIISLRGTIVPVVDLRLLLGLERRVISRQSRILVLRADGDPVGLLVDQVTSVVRLESDAVEPPPRAMQRHASEMLSGVGRLGGRLIIILNAAAVLDVMENAA